MNPEQVRQRVLELIDGWINHSNARESEAAMNVLNALAGDIMIMDITKAPGQISGVGHRKF